MSGVNPPKNFPQNPPYGTKEESRTSLCETVAGN